MMSPRDFFGGETTVQRFPLALAAALTIGAALPTAGAQMLGTPVLQNAFSNPGFTIAANYGTGGDASAYGGAVAWAPRRAVVQLSGGAVGVGGLSASGATTLRVPAGVSIGYRRALGRDRGVSGYVAPFYSWSRLKADGATDSAGRFRISFGVDVAVLPALGLTVGYETGSEARAGEPGPTGGLFGIGLSYALRRPR
jgi:hypothetical protein